MLKKAIFASLFGLYFCGFGRASGDTIVTVNTSDSSGVEHATADFAFGTNTVSVTLTNLAQDPASAGSLLGGVTFTMAPIPTPGTTSVTSASGKLIDISYTNNIASDYTGDSAAELAHWVFSNTSDPDTFKVNTNDPLIIGYGTGGSSTTYTNANSSITGNKNQAGHQPFIQYSGTFVFDIQGVTSSTRITNASLLFGTNFSGYTGTVTTTPNSPRPTPLPKSAWAALPCLGLAALRRKSLKAC